MLVIDGFVKNKLPIGVFWGHGTGDELELAAAARQSRRQGQPCRGGAGEGSRGEVVEGVL